MKTYSVLTALLALGLGPVLAQDETPKPAPEPPPAETTPPKPPPPDEPPAPPDWKNKGGRKQGEKLAAQFGVTQQEVFDLRAKGLGWGEVRHALAIARKADVPVADVLKLRDSGMGWGKISQNYGFKLGEAEHGALKDRDGDEDRDDKRDAVGERKDGDKAVERGLNGALNRGGDRGGERGRSVERGGERGRSGERGGSRGGPPSWSHGGGRR